MKLNHTIKLILGLLLFLVLPSGLFFTFIYFKYDEPVPTGIQGKQADSLARQMLDALNYPAFLNTNHLEWTYKYRRHYKWDRKKGVCTVYWDEYKVQLHFHDSTQSQAYVHNFKVIDDKATQLIQKAKAHFRNDSFWLLEPYRVMDSTNTRSLVTTENNEPALLVKTKNSGLASNDTYLWTFDRDGKPKSCKIWTSKLPIGGIEASWNNWITTNSGAVLPYAHEVLFTRIELSHIAGDY